LAMRQGIFPGRVNDPTTRQPFPNNTIPSAQWDPVAAKLLPLYPLPNLTGARNFFYNPREKLAGDQFNIRGDHRIANHDSVFGRFSESWNDNRLPPPLPEPANQQGAVNLVARSVMVSETHTFRSANRVNEFRLGQIYSLENQDLLGPRL